MTNRSRIFELRERKEKVGRSGTNLFEIPRTITGKSRPEHDQNVHVHAIYCRPDVADDIISGQCVGTFRDYSGVNV